VGLQLEDGPRLERKVDSALTEQGVKLFMWDLFDYPVGPLFLHMRNAADETVFEFQVGPQWTYILRRQPAGPPKKRESEKASVARVATDVFRPPQKTKPRSAQPPEITHHVTAWCGTRTTNLTVREDMAKGDLIDWIVTELGEPRGSYAMDIHDVKGRLIPEYRVMEGWSYRIHRISPPGTQEAADQELRKRGNETRPVLNRSSVTVWDDDASRAVSRPPQWVREESFRAETPRRPNDLVWIKLQKENGPSCERQVKCSTTEPDLKQIMWECLGRPEGPLYLHIEDEKGAVKEMFRIAAGWKYILRRQPRSPLKNGRQPKEVRREEGDQRSATRQMREAHIIADKQRANASGVAQKKSESRTEARTAAPGTSRTSRTIVGSSPRLG
jgi:hypothetical protein